MNPSDNQADHGKALLRQHYRDEGEHRTVSSSSASKRNWNALGSIASIARFINRQFSNRALRAVTAAGLSLFAADEYRLNSKIKYLQTLQVTGSDWETFSSLGKYKAVSVHDASRAEVETGIKGYKEFKPFHDGLDKFRDEVSKCATGHGAPAERCRGWMSMVDRVQDIKDPIVRSSAISDWVEKVIPYDNAKWEGRDKLRDLTNWFPAPIVPLVTGLGVCVHHAGLSYIGSLQAGGRPEETMILYLAVKTKKEITGHAVLAVVDGERKAIIERGVAFRPEAYFSANLAKDYGVEYLKPDEVLGMNGIELYRANILENSEKIVNNDYYVKSNSGINQIFKDSDAFSVVDAMADNLVAKLKAEADSRLQPQKLQVVPKHQGQ